MVNTTLRAYLDELNLLLEQEALEEVIGHCRHILQHYPKNVETYRLLGRALLEKGRYEEAAEVFQRVLSALPEDFVSHLGLSSVAEERNQIPTAIWHLERAYEQDPNNMALQGELKRLYEANGTAPERVQLTQGALIRIYAKGRLYDQANRELQTALAQQPNRFDLLLLQADVLWNSDHPVEAAEIGLHILGNLPDSVQANRLLASLWLKSGRPSEAEPFVARLEQLDPFLAWQIVHPDGKQVPADAFQLSHLDWDARAAASLATDVPDWVNAISNVFEAPESVSLSGGVSNWLEEAAPAPSPEPRAKPEAPQAATPDWLEEPVPAAQNDVPDWFKEPAVKDTESSAGSNLPDWFEEAINTPDEAASPALADQADEQLPSGFTDLLMGTSKPESTPSAPSAPQTSESIPDWLADVQPAPPPEPIDAMSWLKTGPLPPLEEATLSTPEAPAEPAPANVDWLSDLPPVEPSPSEPEPAAAEVSDLDWLSGTGSSTPEGPEEPGAASIDWLSDLPPVELSPSEPEPAAAEVSDLDWLSGMESSTPEAPAEPAPASVDWLNDLPPIEPSPSEPEPAAAEVSDLDWLSSMESATPEAPAELAAAEVSDLDWLSSMESATPEAPAEPATSAEPQEDWLSGLRPTDTGNLPPELEALPPEAEAEPAAAEVSDLNWLSGMGSATPEAPAEPATSAEPQEDWLSGLRPTDTGNLPPELEALPPEAEAEPAAAEVSDLDWLSGMGSATPETPAEPATSAEPGLDWLSAMQPADQTPAETEPAPADDLDWLRSMSSGDVPPASSPSAQPGEPEVFEVKGKNQEPVPDEWLSNTVEFDESTGIVTEGDPMAWLRPYTETTTGGTPSAEPTPADSEPTPGGSAITDETPAWLSSMMPSTPPGPSSSAVPLDDLDFGGLDPTSPATQEQPDSSAAPQPAEEDWLSSIGETPVSPASPTALDWLAESQEPADEHPLELEDDWLASFEIGGQPQTEEQQAPPMEPAEPAAPSADWLSTLSLNPSESSEPASQSADWLGSLAGEPDTSQPGVSTGPELETSAESATADDWMAALNISEPAPVDEGPGWMSEPAAETAEPQQPEWLATPEAKDHFDNLLKHATQKANEPRVIGDTGVLGSDMPDWLSAFGDNAGALAPEQPAEAAEPAEERTFSPDWLSSDMSLETLAASSQTELPPPENESVEPGTVPDWLSAIAPAGKPSVDAEEPSTVDKTAPTAPTVPMSLEDLDFGSLDTAKPQAEPRSEDALDWLSMPATSSAEPAELALPENLVNTNGSTPAGQPGFEFDRPPAWRKKKKDIPGQSSQDWPSDAGSHPNPDDLTDWRSK